MTPEQERMTGLLELQRRDPEAAADLATSIAALWVTFVYSMGVDIECGNVPCPSSVARPVATDVLLGITRIKTDVRLRALQEQLDE